MDLNFLPILNDVPFEYNAEEGYYKINNDIGITKDGERLLSLSDKCINLDMLNGNIGPIFDVLYHIYPSFEEDDTCDTICNTIEIKVEDESNYEIEQLCPIKTEYSFDSIFEPGDRIMEPSENYRKFGTQIDDSVTIKTEQFDNVVIKTEEVNIEYNCGENCTDCCHHDVESIENSSPETPAITLSDGSEYESDSSLCSIFEELIERQIYVERPPDQWPRIRVRRDLMPIPPGEAKKMCGVTFLLDHPKPKMALINEEEFRRKYKDIDIKKKFKKEPRNYEMDLHRIHYRALANLCNSSNEEFNECLIEDMQMLCDSISKNVSRHNKFREFCETEIEVALSGAILKNLEEIKVNRVKEKEEAKTKRWCMECKNEAQFYCCWMGYYCSTDCHEKDWPDHYKTCQQFQMKIKDSKLKENPLVTKLLREEIPLKILEQKDIENGVLGGESFGQGVNTNLERFIERTRRFHVISKPKNVGLANIKSTSTVKAHQAVNPNLERNINKTRRPQKISKTNNKGLVISNVTSLSTEQFRQDVNPIIRRNAKRGPMFPMSPKVPQEDSTPNNLGFIVSDVRSLTADEDNAVNAAVKNGTMVNIGWEEEMAFCEPMINDNKNKAGLQHASLNVGNQGDTSEHSSVENHLSQNLKRSSTMPRNVCSKKYKQGSDPLQVNNNVEDNTNVAKGNDIIHVPALIIDYPPVGDPNTNQNSRLQSTLPNNIQYIDTKEGERPFKALLLPIPSSHAIGEPQLSTENSTVIQLISPFQNVSTNPQALINSNNNQDQAQILSVTNDDTSNQIVAPSPSATPVNSWSSLGWSYKSTNTCEESMIKKPAQNLSKGKPCPSGPLLKQNSNILINKTNPNVLISTSGLNNKTVSNQLAIIPASSGLSASTVPAQNVNKPVPTFLGPSNMNRNIGVKSRLIELNSQTGLNIKQIYCALKTQSNQEIGEITPVPDQGSLNVISSGDLVSKPGPSGLNKLLAPYSNVNKRNENLNNTLSPSMYYTLQVPPSDLNSSSDSLDINNGSKIMINSLPGSSGLNSNPGPSGINSRPGPSGINCKPGPSGINNRPGPSGINCKPGPSGINNKPGPSGINCKPGPSGINNKPGPSGINNKPGPSGINCKPGPSGLNSKLGMKKVKTGQKVSELQNLAKLNQMQYLNLDQLTKGTHHIIVSKDNTYKVAIPSLNNNSKKPAYILTDWPVPYITEDT